MRPRGAPRALPRTTRLTGRLAGWKPPPVERRCQLGNSLAARHGAQGPELLSHHAPSKALPCRTGPWRIGRCSMKWIAFATVAGPALRGVQTWRGGAAAARAVAVKVAENRRRHRTCDTAGFNAAFPSRARSSVDSMRLSGQAAWWARQGRLRLDACDRSAFHPRHPQSHGGTDRVSCARC